jgi:hypothetical protein
MSARTVRLAKEARALFWPWCFVTLAVGSELLTPSQYLADPLYAVSLIAFWVGIPMIAALSLGSEFQHRTLPLLLSQPISRRTLWTEKWLVLLPAMATTVIVYVLTWRLPYREPPEYGVFAVALLVSLCSATFWTLTAKSTIGGVILNLLQAVTILYVHLVLPARYEVGFLIPATAYALLMLWLSRRKFEFFQATGGATGDDLLTANPFRIFSRVVDCRPDQPVLNLLRKEMRLLWPVGLLTLFAVLFLICLAPFRSTLNGGNSAHTVGYGICVGAVLLTSLLAGALSMGEERTLGTHSFQLTSPFSVRKQWWMKIVVAELTSVLLAATVASVAHAIWGVESFGYPLLAAVVTFAGFWCASAVKGTVRATMIAFPAAAAVLAGFGLGGFFLGLNRGILNRVIERFHPFPISSETAHALSAFSNRIEFWFPVPLILVAAIQAYRLFRTEITDSFRPVIRYLLPLTMIAVAGGMLLFAPLTFITVTSSQTWTVLTEVGTAVGRMNIDVSSLDAAHPLTFRLEDLAMARPSDLARHWLKDATITVIPTTFTLNRPTNRRLDGGMDGKGARTTFLYYTTVQLRHGWICRIAGDKFPVSSCSSPSGSWGSPTFP